MRDRKSEMEDGRKTDFTFLVLWFPNSSLFLLSCFPNSNFFLVP